MGQSEEATPENHIPHLLIRKAKHHCQSGQEAGLSNVEELEKLFSEAKDQKDFSTTLKAMNVNSKPLQEKLWKLLKSKSKAQ